MTDSYFLCEMSEQRITTPNTFSFLLLLCDVSAAMSAEAVWYDAHKSKSAN